MTRLKVIQLVIGCVLGLAFLQSVPGMAEAPPGSVYVPMDSWVYSAFDRIAARGTINKQFVGLRPWTRMQCAQLVAEFSENFANQDGQDAESLALGDALRQEFKEEIERIGGDPSRQARLESVYTRAMGISGTPLRDSFHFGQTLVNDFGRPFNTGFSNVTGFSALAEGGRFFAYVRGEYQHSPPYAGLSLAQQTYVEQLDGTATAPYSQATGPLNNFDLLDTYVGLRLGDFDVTFGKQSLWWGPGTMGPMLASDNIDPIPMLKLNQVDPMVLPGFLARLGPVRVQAFFGKLAGHHFPPGAYMHGEKILLKPTPNLEVGFSRTNVGFGVGIPFTLRDLLNSYFSFKDGCCVPGGNLSGDNKSGFDFSYRIPRLRRWLTLYDDSFSDDDPSPLVNPGRGFHNPGIYLSQIPRLRKFDFRFELANTTWSREKPYYNWYYKDSYTNDGLIIGDTVGRRGSAFDVTSTYWVSPRKQVQVGWREQRVSHELIPSGGAQDSLQVKATWLVQKQTELSFFVQHERWSFPFLATGKQADNVVSFQLTVYPTKVPSRTALRTSN